MECIEQTINGSVGAGSRTTTTVSRNGDLVSGMYIKVGPCTWKTLNGNNPGHNILDSVECEIGGQKIDKHYGHWMETHAQLTEENPGTVTAQVHDDTGNMLSTKFQKTAAAGGILDGDVNATGARYVPLRFWFCRNAGLALPLIALQYHEVKVIVNWSAAVAASGSTVSSNVSLWADYIYLDTDERRRFAQVSHEYLIEQVQHQDGSANAVSTELNFNHPVKELIWVGKVGSNGPWGAAHADAGLLASVEGSSRSNWQLKLNGHDRFAEQDTNYFTKLQVWNYHSGAMQVNDSIAVYSFSLKPEEHQPSGTCNFSRIDNAQLKSSNSANAVGLNIYAVNYNVLRIMSGMGGLAYSN